MGRQSAVFASLFKPGAPPQVADANDTSSGVAPAAAQTASDRETGLNAEDVAESSDDGLHDVGKDFTARPEDLLTLQEAHRARRRQEESDDEWSRRQALLRAEPDPARRGVLVVQKESERLAVREATEDLGAIERATVADIHFAEEHQHEALIQAGGLLVAGMLGANMGEGAAATAGHKHRHALDQESELDAGDGMAGPAHSEPEAERDLEIGG